jgi:hypothetical protein
MLLPAAGTALGVVSLRQPRRHRGWAVVGLTVNAVLLAFLLLVTVPALLHEITQ